ncbi:MAG: adenylate/guanylate cyclase domain-containing protein [Leptospiraceae bacterium]|nr:adenylate/guanylate cyclase domain-containing protein [Leptospiraceae bacterium]
MQLKNTEELLVRREVRALITVMVLRVVYSTFMAVGTLLVGKSDWEKAAASSLAALVILSVWPFWMALRKRKWILGVGISGLLLDLGVYFMMPVIWYNSVGGSEVLPAYIVKHPNVMALGYLLVIFHSAAGRPLYPVLATMGVVALQSGYLLFAAADPRTVFSSDFVAHMTGSSISLEFMVSNLFTFLGCGMALAYLVRLNRRTLRDAVTKEVDNARLSRYFSPSVQTAILEQSADPFAEEGMRKDVAVLFSDLRGFTALSENQSPETVLQWLREYHSAMVEIIFRHGGTLDKFLGDGILAVFGAPSSQGDDADRALKAAVEMQLALKRWNLDRLQRALPEFQQGIGLHFGPATVGNVGVQERLEYTVIGDTVNVASRLQGMCKDLKKDTLISAALIQACQNPPALEAVGRHSIRGREGSLDIFTI